MVCMDSDWKPVLALSGGLAMFVAFLLGIGVLSDPTTAARLGGGAVPDADLSGVRTAAVASIASAGTAVVATFASRMIVPIVVILVVCVPFALMSLYTLGLTF